MKEISQPDGVGRAGWFCLRAGSNSAPVKEATTDFLAGKTDSEVLVIDKMQNPELVIALPIVFPNRIDFPSEVLPGKLRAPSHDTSRRCSAHLY